MAIYIPIVSEFKSTGIDKAKKEFKSLEGAGAKAGFLLKKSFLPATAALGAFGGFMVAAAKGAEDARIANEKLGSVLDTMGYGKATDRVSAYAESLEKTIAVDADVIKATQTKLATFGALTKSVGKAGGAFDRATKAALDMAAAGFGTAEGNAVQLGKALQDPIKGLAALAKSGVTFNDQEKANIKTLVESGQTLKAQELILKAIEGQVGGTAEASASSFDKMKFAVAGVSDTFGDMMLPVIDALAPKLAAFSAWAQANPGLMKIVVGTFVALTAAVVALNIAMSLNPVSLIVIGLGLLVAGLAAAYMRFEAFRKVVDLVFGAIKFGVTEIAIPYIKMLVNVWKGVFNAIATIWNNTLGKISFTVPSWIPKIGGAGFSFPQIPMLAEGGIVNAPTLAIIGEAGPEAVVPLDRMNEFGMGRAGNNVTINVQGGDPQAVVDALVKYSRQNGSLPSQVKLAS
jgi:phage-related minor tail protein